MRAKHPCATTNCPTLVAPGHSHCPTHTITREERNPKDPAQAKFYGSTQWKGMRVVIRRRDPICKVCHRKPSTQVDHIDGDWKNNAPENLRGICKDCHDARSGSQHFKKREIR